MAYDGSIQFDTKLDTSGLETGLKAVPGLLSGALQQMVQKAEGLWSMLTDAMGSALAPIAEAAKKAVQAAIEAMKTAIGGGIGGIIKALTGLGNGGVNGSIGEFIAGGIRLVTAIGTGIKNGITRAKSAVTSVIKTLRDAFESGGWTAVGGAIIDGIAAGIRNLASKAVTAARNAAANVLNAFKKALGIHSPSRVMRDEVGKMLMLGLAEGIRDNEKEASDAFQAVMDALDLQRTFSLVSEAEYYEQMRRLRDRYLTAGTRQWYEYTEKIYNHQVAAEEKLRDSILASYDAVAEQAKARMEDVEKSRASLETKLSGYGDLVTKQEVVLRGSGEMRFDEFKNEWFFDGDRRVMDYDLGAMQSQLETLEEYGASLRAVKERLRMAALTKEESRAFFAEMASLDVESAAAFAKQLGTATDSAFSGYMDAWAKKQALAGEIASELYASDFREAAEETAETLTRELEQVGLEVPKSFFASGISSAQQFGAAFRAELETQLASIRAQIVTAQEAWSAGAGGTSAVTTYQSTINLAASGETASQQLRAARAYSDLERLRFA